MLTGSHSLGIELAQPYWMVRKAVGFFRSISFVGWGNLLFVFGQAYVYIRYLHIDEDDAFYVGAASTAVATDTIFSINPYTGAEYAKLPSRYVLSPFFSFTAFLSKISHVHPAVTAHVVLAAVLILTSYSGSGIHCGCYGYDFLD